MMHRVIYNHASSTAIANRRDALWFVGHGEGAQGDAEAEAEERGERREQHASTRRAGRQGNAAKGATGP